MDHVADDDAYRPGWAHGGLASGPAAGRPDISILFRPEPAALVRALSRRRTTLASRGEFIALAGEPVSEPVDQQIPMSAQAQTRILPEG
jgi:hypothetical protein